MEFDLDKLERKIIWSQTIELLESYYSKTNIIKASSKNSKEEISASLIKTFDKKKKPLDAINYVVNSLTEYAVHTPHPNYFGLFNPRPNFPSIIADVITATFNPQLAAWSHAPFASEVEDLLIHEFGKKFGYKEPEIDGVFTSGGAEANLTAILCGINYKFPDVAKQGIFSIGKPPKIYCSVESHHTAVKSARICGLGSSSIVYIPVNKKQEMIPELLEKQIEKDVKNGQIPLLIFATLGTTGTGGIDPIIELSKIAKNYDCWLHADAAYGGAVALTNSFGNLIKGINLADSITFDAHKWLSVPMATSLFITNHTNILGQTFSIDTDYMPNDEDDVKMRGSYTHSIQWSRRFIGLKLYLPLLIFGWKGYEETILHQLNLGKILESKLTENKWTIYNQTDLPIVCFSDTRFVNDSKFAKYIVEKITEYGEAWVSTYPFDDKFTIRACITNYSSTQENINNLVKSINKERENYIQESN